MDSLPLFERNVILSVRPKYASKIISCEKSVELRRRFPEFAATGASAFIYSSSPVSAVVGITKIASVLKLPINEIWRKFSSKACIAKDDFEAYFSGLDKGFVILLEDVREFRTALKASDLRQSIGFRPPQSFQYASEDFDSLLNDEIIHTSNRYQRRNRA